MSLEQIAAKRTQLEAQLASLSQKLNSLPRTPMGLIPDSVRATEEYSRPKAEYDRLFRQLQRLNSRLTPRQKRALRQRNRKAA
jgi:hypothetical protein